MAYQSRKFTLEKRVINLAFENITRHGIEPVLELLKVTRRRSAPELREMTNMVRISEETPEQKQLIALALEKCCEIYRIKRLSDLYNSRRRGNYSECRHLLMVLMKHVIGLKERAIAEHWGRDKRIVYRAMESFTQKDKNHFLDKVFLENYETVKNHIS